MAMKPVQRRPVDKHGAVGEHGSAKQFRRDVSRTHRRNLVAKPLRGGWRL